MVERSFTGRGRGRGSAGLFIGLLCVVLVYSTAVAAEVTARLDRDRIVQGETVTLVIQTDDPQLSLEGDFSVLSADFEILDRRSESQMSIVNGQQSAVVRQMITLEPRRTGTLSIPALKFGDNQTQPLRVNVDPAPEPQPGEAPAVFIDVEVEPRDGPYYVHSQLRLTVRVYYQQNLTEAAITPPAPSPASVRLLDEVPFQADRAGIRYKVLERQYAIFPERSGTLSIPSMKLSGRMVERRSDNLWQPAVRGRRVTVESDPLELKIEPKPAVFTGSSWQPARQLELSQNISASDTLTVGEPVTRTVIVDAVGLEENMITEPEWPEIQDARIYPDQPQGITRDDGKWVLGHKEFRYAVVPEQEGELVLPRIEMPWWDTVNDRQVVAVLPEKRLQVLPSAAQSAVPPPPSQVAIPEPGSVAAPSTPGQARATGLWAWLALLFFVLWLVTLVLYLRRPRSAVPAERLDLEVAVEEKSLLSQLQQACQAGSASEVRLIMARWLRAYGPASANGSLLALASLTSNKKLQDALRNMDASGFDAAGDSGFDGPGLWAAFSEWRKQWLAERKQKEPEITDLYAVSRRTG